MCVVCVCTFFVRWPSDIGGGGCFGYLYIIIIIISCYTLTTIIQPYILLPYKNPNASPPRRTTVQPPANRSGPGDGGGAAFLWRRRRRAPLSRVAEAVAAAAAAAPSSSSTVYTRRHASSDQCVRRRPYGDYTVDATGPVGLRRSEILTRAHARSNPSAPADVTIISYFY